MLKYFAGVGKVWGSALAHRVQKGGIPGKKKSIHDLPTGTAGQCHSGIRRPAFFECPNRMFARGLTCSKHGL